MFLRPGSLSGSTGELSEHWQVCTGQEGSPSQSSPRTCCAHVGHGTSLHALLLSGISTQPTTSQSRPDRASPFATARYSASSQTRLPAAAHHSASSTASDPATTNHSTSDQTTDATATATSHMGNDNHPTSHRAAESLRMFAVQTADSHESSATTCSSRRLTGAALIRSKTFCRLSRSRAYANFGFACITAYR